MKHWLTFFQVALWGAATFALVMALLPQPPQPPGMPSDKVQHMAAFLVLAVLASQAYPRAGLLMVGMVLSAFGAFIELGQLIPLLHRDADVVDWVADTVAVVAALSLVGLWRRIRNAKHQT